MPSSAEGRVKNLCLFQPSGGGEKRLERNFAAAVFAQSAVGKFAAQRGWPGGYQGGYPGGRAMAKEPNVGPRDRLPAGARLDAGLHRRPGGGGSRRHARRDGASRRRSQKD